MNKYLVAGIVALPTYVAGLVGLEAFSLFNSHPVTTQRELEELVVAEKARLECQAPIKPILSFQGTARFLAKDAHGEYTLLVGELGANNRSIKHEVYHICKGHVDGEPSFLKYFFWNEPITALYEAFGIRF